MLTATLSCDGGTADYHEQNENMNQENQTQKTQSVNDRSLFSAGQKVREEADKWLLFAVLSLHNHQGVMQPNIHTEFRSRSSVWMKVWNPLV